MTAPMIEVAGASKWFGDVVAVSDVSFSIGPGVTALLGPNGAGKSTLLRMLCGLTAADQGHVRVLGADPRTDLAVRARIGIVPQQEAVFEALKRALGELAPAQDVQTGLFSVMAIVQPSGTDVYHYFTKTIAAGNYYTWALAQWSDASFQFKLYAGSINPPATVSGLTVGETYLLVGVREAVNCYLWVKNLSTGVMTSGSDEVLTMSASTQPIYIGRRGGSSPGVFRGVGSGYAIWNRALSEQDVITLCNEPAALIWEPGRKSISLSLIQI